MWDHEGLEVGMLYTLNPLNCKQFIHHYKFKFYEARECDICSIYCMWCLSCIESTVFIPRIHLVPLAPPGEIYEHSSRSNTEHCCK